MAIVDFMKCPNDQTTLVISERQNIEIDYCPECRGVWLDRGELDKLLERAQGAASPSSLPERQQYARSDQYSPQYSDERHYKKKKKESFLGDIFDF
jgi:Zn-finger nucleic acid-binding protein